MKTITKILLALMLVVGISYADAFKKEVSQRSYVITMSSDKPLVAGNNEMKFDISSASKSVDGAKVVIKAFMPAMPGMPYMESVSETNAVGLGKYDANIDFPMGGTWQIHIFIEPKEGKKARIKTSVNI